MLDLLDPKTQSAVPAAPATVALPRKLTDEGIVAFIQRTVRELNTVKFALLSFVVNNLRRRYRRSILGFAWSLINPLLTMLVMTVVFSVLFQRDPRTFSVYVFTGLLPFQFIKDSITLGGPSIVQGEHFLKKVYLNKTFFPLVTVATEGTNFCFSLFSLMALAFCLGLKLQVSMVLLPAVILILFVFNAALALTFSIATVYFRDLTHISEVVLGAAIYLCPILYPMSLVPAQYKVFFMLNPFYWFIELFRLVICEGRIPSAIDWGVPLAIMTVAVVFSLLILKRKERDLIFRL